MIPDNRKALEQFETIDIKVLDNVTQEVMMKLIAKKTRESIF
ncbi:conserved hypothetical protein [Listeria monocytogenes]|nr:conserved hypothetical protein [Listeria monocytogenes FSL N3-165]EXL15024.1 hypothetical protein X843_1310 [Listeria monocytogenes Lm_1840]QBZ18669.1 hypothetical protein FORC68_1441 [Listeria monocytogenes]CUL85751.1 conserved hypothetical protein [Listeria monocytogenes]